MDLWKTKKKIQVELPFSQRRKKRFLFSSVWDDFSHSQEAAQSLDLSLPLLPPSRFLPSSSSPHTHHVSAPSSGAIEYSSNRRPLLYFWVLQGHRFAWTSSGGSHRQHPLFLFFAYVPFSCRTSSSSGSLLFFYFEVEFLHLCLMWKKKTNRDNEQISFR